MKKKQSEKTIKTSSGRVKKVKIPDVKKAATKSKKGSFT